MKIKFPHVLKNEARDNCYLYFDKNIRPLEKNSNGKIDPSAIGLENNDVDAFRHACVSGVMTIEYSELAADILGRMNEFLTPDLYSNSKDPRSLNMDLWNNAVGRKYGELTNSTEELFKLIHKALDNGELIVALDDSRKYSGLIHNLQNKSKPIIVLKEDENGRNEIFFDLIEGKVFQRSEFILKIKEGLYPNYFVKVINGIETPVSKPDSRETNNLG
ncbi:MAG: hypothetical protein ACJAT2_002330 [Bacteriovoracaceae bacterium]|jgi:hypothetical protein